MDKAGAQSLLASPSFNERLRGARYFARVALPGDLDLLRAALEREQVVWVRAALKQAIALAEGNHTPAQAVDYSKEDPEREAIDELHAQAVEDVTQQLVHEIEPILGRLRQYGQREVRGFEISKTKGELDRLELLLMALDRMSKAASAPVVTDFDLAELIQITADALRTENVPVDLAGPKPLPALGDRALVEMALANGLRNAVEATEAVAREPATRRVVVTWDETDRDYFIVILDRGAGLPAGAERIFEMGSSTKKGHFGLGLALARQAVRSLRGSISLGPRGDGGARYEFRWPKLPRAAE